LLGRELRTLGELGIAVDVIKQFNVCIFGVVTELALYFSPSLERI